MRGRHRPHTLTTPEPIRPRLRRERAPLSNSTNYTVTVVSGAGGVADLEGNTLAANFTSSYTTIAPLSVVGFTPTNGSSNIAVSTAVTVQFDNAMNASTINSSTIVLTDGTRQHGRRDPLPMTPEPDTATITPAAALSNSTTYTLTAFSGARA